MKCINRLTVIGTKQQVKAFQKSSLATKFNAKFVEPLEFSDRRFVCQFETDKAPTEEIKSASLDYTGLTLLLDFELPQAQTKGLAKAQTGELTEYRIKY